MSQIPDFNAEYKIEYKWKGKVNTLSQLITPNKTTIAELKKILEQETKVKPTKQTFIGLLKSKDENQLFTTILSKQVIKSSLVPPVIQFTLLGTPEEEIVQQNQKMDFILDMCTQEVEQIEVLATKYVQEGRSDLKQVKMWNESLMQKLLQLDNHDNAENVDRVGRKELINKIQRMHEMMDKLLK